MTCPDCSKDLHHAYPTQHKAKENPLKVMSHKHIASQRKFLIDDKPEQERKQVKISTPSKPSSY